MLVVAPILMAVSAVGAAARAQSTASFADVKPSPAAPQATAPAQQTQAWAPEASPAAAPVASLPTFAAQPWSPPAQGYGYGYGGYAPAPRQPAPDSAPPGYERQERPRTVTLALGGVALGLPWATGLGIAGASGFPNGSGWLVLPVLGPWAALAKRSNPCDGLDHAKSFNPSVSQCVAEPLTRAMLVFDGVLQATGVVLIIVGSGSDTVLVRKGAADGTEIAAAPSTLGGRGYGASVIGRF